MKSVERASPWPRRAQAIDQLEVVGAGVAASHPPQHPVGARLDGEVQVGADVLVAPDLLDHARREIARVGGDEAQARQAVQRRHRGQQVGEVGAAGRLAPVVDRLAEELDLEEAVVDQVAHLAHHLGERAAALRAAGLGHDAEGADLVAPLDDRDHPLVLAVTGDRVDVVAPLLRESRSPPPGARPAARRSPAPAPPPAPARSRSPGRAPAGAPAPPPAGPRSRTGRSAATRSAP